MNSEEAALRRKYPDEGPKTHPQVLRNRTVVIVGANEQVTVRPAALDGFDVTLSAVEHVDEDLRDPYD